MVFGQPVYNTQQRRAALAEFKRYIDELRQKKNLPPWKVVKKKKKIVKRINKINNLGIKIYKRIRKRRRRQTMKNRRRR